MLKFDLGGNEKELQNVEVQLSITIRHTENL